MKIFALQGLLDGQPHIFMRRCMTSWQAKQANEVYEKLGWDERWRVETATNPLTYEQNPVGC